MMHMTQFPVSARLAALLFAGAILILAGCASYGTLEKAKGPDGANRGSFEIIQSETKNENDGKEKAVQGVESRPLGCPLGEPKRVFGAGPYYEGPLIDAHLHMPSLFAPPPGADIKKYFNPAVLGTDVTINKIACLLEREKIAKAVGFFLVLDFLQGATLQVAIDAQKNYPGKFEPFLMPTPLTRPTFTPQEYGKIVNANPGLFKGYGELGFYLGVFSQSSPDDDTFMGIFKVAQGNGHVVMIHPAAQTIEGLEIAIQKNPDVIFLLHGEGIADEIVPLVEKYPNVYFTLDTALLPGIYGFDNKEDFKANFEKNFSSHLERSISKWKPPIEKNPDSFVWGTDRGEGWHFDEGAGDYMVEMSRAFIGRLDPGVQEKFAYKNAQNMLEGKKTGAKSPVAPITKTPFTGMEGLCTTAEKCNEFCQNNYGRCKQYCNSNPQHPICLKSFSFGQGKQDGGTGPWQQAPAATRPTPAGGGKPPVLSNLAFEIAPWDKGTNKAGDLIFTKKLLFNDGRVSNDKVFVEFGHSDTSRPGMPWVEYWFFVPLGTKVRAPAGGSAKVSFFEHTNDWGINIDNGSGWEVGLEHLAKVNVKSGDVVKAGDIVGEAAPRKTFNNEIAMTELAVFRGGVQVEKFCPFQFLEDSLKSEYSQKLTRLAKDWEEFIGKDVYQEEKWVAPGCLMEKIIEK